MIWGCILRCPDIWHDLIYFQSLLAPAVICWTRFGKLKTHSSIIFQSESVYAWLQNHQLITHPLETILKPKKTHFSKDIHLPSLGNDTNEEDPVIPLPRWGSSHGRSICRSTWEKNIAHTEIYIQIYVYYITSKPPPLKMDGWCFFFSSCFFSMSGSKTLGFSCDLLVLVTIIGLQGLELLKDQNPGAREDAAGMGDQWWVQGICLPFLSIN